MLGRSTSRTDFGSALSSVVIARACREGIRYGGSFTDMGKYTGFTDP